ncbi:MAG: RES family NAD+ phosphorylase [Bryobacteraceae bacterium]
MRSSTPPPQSHSPRSRSSFLFGFATDYVLSRIEIPEEVKVRRIDATILPLGWDSAACSRATQAVGQAWALALDTPVSEVPSAIIPSEANYLLNPKHRDFKLIRFLPRELVTFDPRLK